MNNVSNCKIETIRIIVSNLKNKGFPSTGNEPDLEKLKNKNNR